MSDQRHIEELRDKLSILKHDAEYLYRYGSPANSIELFNKLSLDDRKILIYLALSEEDKDVQNVSHYLMQQLSPAPRNRKELLTQMSPEIRVALEDKPSTPKSLAAIDEQRIIEELRKGCDRIGHFKIEEAFWILIPNDPAEEAVWIKAVGGKDEILSRVRMPSQVIYYPQERRKLELITAMRGALWILHIHNHPELPGYISLCEPSDNDRSFALQWKSVRSWTEGKMKFFVVQGASVIEYSLPQGRTKKWRIGIRK